MLVKNITSDVVVIPFSGSEVGVNTFHDIPDDEKDVELYEKLEELVNNDSFLVSLDGITTMTKDKSLRYLKNYTRDKTQYLVYDNVYAHTRIKDLGDIDYKVDLADSLYPVNTYKFGRRIRKIAYWYNGGSPDLTSPIILVNYDYSFDIAGLVSSIEKRISYYKRDGSIEQDEKIVIETFDYLKKGEEQANRRRYIYREVVALAQVVLITSGQYTPEDIVSIASSFIAAIDDKVNKYINNGDYEFVDLLSNNTVSEIETELGLSDLSFLSFTYNSAPFKDTFVTMLDYRAAELATPPSTLYSGSLL